MPRANNNKIKIRLNPLKENKQGNKLNKKENKKENKLNKKENKKNE